MLYTINETNHRAPDNVVFQSLEPVVRGMGMALVELSVYHGKGANVQVKAIVCGKGNTGIDDCSMVHRGILPRLELAFPEKDIYLEVSSPGINRTIKDGSEFAHYIGRRVKCFCTDISDWKEGVLRAADEEKIVFENESGETALPYETIAKARLIE